MMQSHTMQPHSIDSYSNLCLQASDDVDEEPIVPIRQHRPEAVEISPSIPADSTTKRTSGEATDSFHSSKHLHVRKGSHSAEPPKVTRGPSSSVTLITQPSEAAKTAIPRDTRTPSSEKCKMKRKNYSREVPSNHCKRLRVECIYIHAANPAHARK
jgi:hypothetical protein